MAKATWNGVTLAESDTVAHVEGNAYFPRDSVNWEYFKDSNAPVTFCHWKGFASYLDVLVDGDELTGAAWKYDDPYEGSLLIKDHVAFWKGVEISGGPEGRGYVEPVPSLRGSKTGWEALCWLIRHTDKSELDAADIQANTDLTEDQFPAAWQMPDVQRYARRYRWTLESSDPIRLTRSEGDPVSV
jgi:uncharacterized protein (DUF427 family)